MNQKPSSTPDSITTSRPTKIRLRPTSTSTTGRPAAFDPAQIAGGAVYAILLYLGILYSLGLIARTASLTIGVQNTIALIGSLLLTGLVFGTIAVLRDHLSRKPVGMAPEKVLRLDDTLRWMVPPDVMAAYLEPMTLLRLNLLDLIAAADDLQQRVPRVRLHILACSACSPGDRTFHYILWCRGCRCPFIHGTGYRGVATISSRTPSDVCLKEPR